MRVLVVAAHPDDEVLGVGGTILKHVSDGDGVFVCIATKAFEPDWPKEYMDTKIKEQVKVDALLGIKKRFNLSFVTTKLNTVAHGELSKAITAVVDEVNPDVMYVHFEGDLNNDHAIVFRASMVAARPPRRIKLFCYETLSETEWYNAPFSPNVWVDIASYIDKKKQAFSIYKSEVKSFPHPRSLEGIETLAKKRGTEICTAYAEAFSLIREFRS